MKATTKPQKKWTYTEVMGKLKARYLFGQTGTEMYQEVALEVGQSIEHIRRAYPLKAIRDAIQRDQENDLN
jgi:hypothetical protein